jgi:DNA-binding GntR family transcriptional regulator
MKKLALDTPRASPLQRDLARQIAALVAGGELRAGEQLTEVALARRLGVSRTPVRAALGLLQVQGVVDKRDGAGQFVSPQAARRAAGLLNQAAPTEDALYSAIIADRARHALSDTLSESELAGRYGADRRALDRVLLRLNQEGLIARRPGRGWQFLPMLDSDSAKAESYRIRLVLECASLREPSFRVDPELLARTRQAHEQFLKLKAAAQTPASFFEISAGFHEMLGLFSGNRFFHEVIARQSRLRRFEEFASYNRGVGRLATAAREHLQVMKAMEDGDLAWAEALLHRHLSTASTF